MKYLKNECPWCGGKIEFPSNGVGQQIDCPHCEGPFELKAKNSPDIKRIILGLLLMAIVVVLAVETSVPTQNSQTDVAKQTPKPNPFDRFDPPKATPVWMPPASDRIIQPAITYTPASPIIILKQPVPDTSTKAIADELRRANDLAERQFRNNQFDSLDAEFQREDAADRQNFYQSQMSWDIQRQTYDLDRISDIYQQEYFNSQFQHLH